VIARTANAKSAGSAINRNWNRNEDLAHFADELVQDRVEIHGCAGPLRRTRMYRSSIGQRIFKGLDNSGIRCRLDRVHRGSVSEPPPDVLARIA